MTKESRKAAMDDQFGGESDAGKVRHQFSSLFKSQNAYMLVYIREAEWDEIMCPVAEEDVALHLRERVRVRARDFRQCCCHYVWTKFHLVGARALTNCKPQLRCHCEMQAYEHPPEGSRFVHCSAAMPSLLSPTMVNDTLTVLLAASMLHILPLFHHPCTVNQATAMRVRPRHASCFALQRQEEERGRKAREEKDKHLYTVIKAARAQDLQEQIGSTLFWDIVDFEQARPWDTPPCEQLWGPCSPQPSPCVMPTWFRPGCAAVSL